MSQTYLGQSTYTLTNTRFHEYFLLAGPFIALIGNAASDIWLTLIVVFFLIHSALERDWTWTKQLWFRLALAFWFWIVFVSIISQWPDNALSEALPWVRFPLFAAALMHWLGRSEKLWQHMLYAIALGVILLAAILVIERAVNPAVLRLYGTWAQSPKPGWYMLGFGLPVLLLTLSEIKRKSGSILWGLPLVLFIFGATIATGEVYVTISMAFGCGLFVLFSRFWSWRILLAGVLCLLTGLSVIGINNRLFYRFTEEILLRLPWLPSSDYYDAWIGGLNAGFKNLLFGLGVDNYEFYCNQLKASGNLEVLGIGNCLPHPHNLYIQAFAETGAVGLIIFTALAVSLIFTVLHKRNNKRFNIPTVIALTIIVVAIWPVSTYSQAFGQHKNLFTWFLIGWSLATTSLFIKYPYKPQSNTNT